LIKTKISQVAENLAVLHAFCLSSFDRQAQKIIGDNFSIIQQFHDLRNDHELLLNAALLVTEYNHYFRKSEEIKDNIRQLYKRADDVNYVYALADQLRQPSVLCHGDLTNEAVVFNQQTGRLLEIRNWDNVHYGNMAEDITHLIVSSSNAHVRRDLYMRVFKAYYYRLVEAYGRAPKFPLAALKESYKKMHKFAVLSGIDRLLSILKSTDIDDDAKRLSADRWQMALEDAVAIENGTYPSDDEDCFFTK